MFLIPQFLVEDKNLPKVLKALAGLTAGNSFQAPRPVVNAEKKGNVIKQVVPGQGIIGILANKLRGLDEETVARPKVVELLVDSGGTESSISTYITMLRDRKIIKPTKKRGVYTIIKAKE